MSRGGPVLHHHPEWGVVVEYLRHHPDSTTAEIKAGTGVAVHSGMLVRMRDHGLIRKSGRNDGGRPEYRWSAI